MARLLYWFSWYLESNLGKSRVGLGLSLSPEVLAFWLFSWNIFWEVLRKMGKENRAWTEETTKKMIKRTKFLEWNMRRRDMERLWPLKDWHPILVSPREKVLGVFGRKWEVRMRSKGEKLRVKVVQIDSID